MESLFPPVLWKSYNQIPLIFKVRFSGDSHSLLDPQAGKPVMGLRTFTTLRELLQCYCSLVFGLSTQRVWDWILSQLRSSYYLTVASSLSLDVEYLFWYIPVCFASDFSSVSCNYGVFVRGAMHKSSPSTILFPALQHFLQLSTVFQLLL